MKTKNQPLLVALALLALANLADPLFAAHAQGTMFTYQGELNEGGNPASGAYELRFALFDSLTNGNSIGIPITNSATPVSNGLFTVTLDFGGVFTGTNYWLDISVRTNPSDTFAELSPRQPVTPTPYAITAANLSAVSENNTVQNGVLFGTISGGGSNVLESGANRSTIGGGQGNEIGTNVSEATIGGGYGNSAGDIAATVGGGYNNSAGGEGSTVSGGVGNSAGGDWSTAAGGYLNTASGAWSTVAGGTDNIASGDLATVAGGISNTASGDVSFAGGQRANAKHNGAFVWADDSAFSFSSTSTNQFRVRATGGAAFITAIDSSGSATAGVHLLAGDAAWSSISDKHAKKNFHAVNGEAILEKLAAIPVEQWNYKWEPDTNTPHIGPMAQEFKGAFYPGRDDTSISTLEFDGVELAAIQGLNQKLEEKDAEIRELQQSVAELRRLVLEATRDKSK